MIPNVFISSTINDLSHLRDSVRDMIIELGYNPVMSEYGDIGYLPTESAEDSCYLAMKDCQLAVMIIGKRYGSLSDNDLSITHNEFRTAREKKQPVIFLVSEETLSFKKVFDANEKGADMNFPGMENPSKIFSFIREFMESDINNGLISYSNVQSAKTNLKKQIAHIVGDLLKKRFDPMQGEIKDILTEITTLRHMLLKNEKDLAQQFSIAYRFLLNPENSFLKDIAEMVAGTLDEAVPELLKSKNIKAFLTAYNVEINEMDTQSALDESRKDFDLGYNQMKLRKIQHAMLPFSTQRERLKGAKPAYDIQPKSKEDNRVILGYGQADLICNENGMNLLNAMFNNLKDKALVPTMHKQNAAN